MKPLTAFIIVCSRVVIPLLLAGACFVGMVLAGDDMVDLAIFGMGVFTFLYLGVSALVSMLSDAVHAGAVISMAALQARDD